jgi:mRNA-degrading endonuclease RelE of RelBE toxin-antitoxin system
MAFKKSYSTRFTRSVKTFRNDRKIAEMIVSAVNDIAGNPMSGQQLKGGLSGIYEHKFGRSPEYRLIYQVYACCESPETCNFDKDLEGDCSGVILFIILATREQMNNLLKKGKKSLTDIEIPDQKQM